MHRHPAVHHGRFYQSFQVVREAEKHRLDGSHIYWWCRCKHTSSMSHYIFLWIDGLCDHWWLLCTVHMQMILCVFGFVYDGLFAHLPVPSLYVFGFWKSEYASFPSFEAGPVMYQCWNRELVVHASVHYQMNRTNPNAFSSRLLDAVCFYFVRIDPQHIVGRQKDDVLAHNSAVRTRRRLERDKRCLCVQWRA